MSGAYNGAGAARGQLADLQRARMLGAMFDVVGERGAVSVTVADIVERSGVSRRTFYEHFEDRDDCLLVAFERALSIARGEVLTAYDDVTQTWRERIRAGLIALLTFCDREPSIARLLICESQANGLRVSERRQEVIAQLTRTVDEGREVGRAESVFVPLVAEGIVAGVLGVIQVRLLDAEPCSSLVGLTSELMSMIVPPYLGGAVARRELERSPPVSVSARHSGRARL